MALADSPADQAVVTLLEGIDVAARTTVKLDDKAEVEPAIGRGDCFFHSVLRLSNPHYVGAAGAEKTKVVYPSL